MDNIEIQIHNEINDYKEKIYFFNFRQWVFAILIVGIVVPTYLILKDKIGEEATSYIIIAIAGILGFIGFVKIHELPAEKLLPYWTRHYFFFSKPVKYISDQELAAKQEKKHKKIKDKPIKNNKQAQVSKEQNRNQAKEKKNQVKQQKLLEKAKKKYKYVENISKEKANAEKVVEEIEDMQVNSKIKLAEKISKLSIEEQEILLELLEK